MRYSWLHHCSKGFHNTSGSAKYRPASYPGAGGFDDDRYEGHYGDRDEDRNGYGGKENGVITNTIVVMEIIMVKNDMVGIVIEMKNLVVEVLMVTTMAEEAEALIETGNELMKMMGHILQGLLAASC